MEIILEADGLSLSDIKAFLKSPIKFMRIKKAMQQYIDTANKKTKEQIEMYKLYDKRNTELAAVDKIINEKSKNLKKIKDEVQKDKIENEIDKLKDKKDGINNKYKSSIDIIKNKINVYDNQLDTIEKKMEKIAGGDAGFNKIIDFFKINLIINNNNSLIKYLNDKQKEKMGDLLDKLENKRKKIYNDIQLLKNKNKRKRKS